MFTLLRTELQSPLTQNTTYGTPHGAHWSFLIWEHQPVILISAVIVQW